MPPIRELLALGIGNVRQADGTNDGAEVDLAMERTDGSVLAFEVKAAPDVRAEDLRGIAALARRLGDDQVTGIVLNTGKHGWRLGPRRFAVPIARLWQP